jgi:hypothetical protein
MFLYDVQDTHMLLLPPSWRESLLSVAVSSRGCWVSGNWIVDSHLRCSVNVVVFSVLHLSSVLGGSCIFRIAVYISIWSLNCATLIITLGLEWQTQNQSISCAPELMDVQVVKGKKHLQQWTYGIIATVFDAERWPAKCWCWAHLHGPWQATGEAVDR